MTPLPCVLRCQECHAAYPDDGHRLRCDHDHGPALLVSEYPHGLRPDRRAHGLYQYRDWLPIRRTLPHGPNTVTYRADALGARLGLADLWVAFHGYWPERGAVSPTASFKDLEAAAVLGRRAPGRPILVIASAGNTAAAFAAACSAEGTPCLLVVPPAARSRLVLTTPRASCVKVLALGDGADYSAAIAVARSVAERPRFEPEGGVWNVARRDGLGTAFLAAVDAMGTNPHWYVQAVGSATGVIAAYEAACRLRMAPLPRMLLCQDASSAPLHVLWAADRAPTLRPPSGSDGTGDPSAAATPELSNRRPPYAVRGGVRDVLEATGGGVVAVSEAAITSAMAMFECCEGIDIQRPAAVALAGLQAQVAAGSIAPTSTVLLNITGGGRVRRARELPLFPVTPDLVVPLAELAGAGRLAEALFDSALVGEA